MSNMNLNGIFNNYTTEGLRGSYNNFVYNNTESTDTETQKYFQPIPESYMLPSDEATKELPKITAELAKLNQQQTLSMLKELLNMPKNFEQFIQQLAAETTKTPAETALILLASTLNMSQLSSLLQNSSKEAMANLYQMVAQYNQLGVSMKNEQLGEISKLISFVMASSSSDVQTLKTVMLMYLPWLPLTNPEVFKLEMNKNGGNSSTNENDSITILIQTENFGNLKADIFKTVEDGIKIEITSSTVFPQNQLDVLMKQESKKFSININMFFDKKEVLNKQKNEISKTQISMNTSPGVNPFLLLISNSFIKNVHLIDEKENLRETRKEKLQ